MFSVCSCFPSFLHSFIDVQSAQQILDKKAGRGRGALLLGHACRRHLPRSLTLTACLPSTIERPPRPNAQLAVLNNSAAEDLGDQDALEAALEAELAAAEEGEAEAAAAAAPTPGGTGKKKGRREGTPTADDEQKVMQQVRGSLALLAAASGCFCGCRHETL